MDAGEAAAESREVAAHAALAEAAILGPVGAIEVADRVVRRRLLAPGRGRSVLAAPAPGQAVPAHDGVLHQGQLVLADLRLTRQGLRRHRGHAPIGWIDDHAGAPAGRPLRCEDGVVGAGHVGFRSPLGADVIPEDRHLRTLAIQLGLLLLGVERGRHTLRALQRDQQLDAPDPLEIRLTPWRP